MSIERDVILPGSASGTVQERRFQLRRGEDANINAMHAVHDLRSPLLLLKTLQKGGAAAPDPEQALMLSMAIERIDEIIRKMMVQRPDRRGGATTVLAPAFAARQAEPVLLASLVTDIVAEQRFIRKASIDILFAVNSKNISIASLVNVSDLKRALTNLVNNAAEAMSGSNGKHRVVIRLAKAKRHAIVTISDNGAGIQENDLLRLNAFQFGVTRKKDGHGIGLAQVWNAVGDAGGTLSFSSSKASGTTVTIRLPFSDPPSWFCDSIEASANAVFLVLDDRRWMHGIWKKTLAGKKARFFTTRLEFERALGKRGTGENYVPIVRHNPNEGLNAVEILQQAKAVDGAIVVLANVQAFNLFRSADKRGLKLLPEQVIRNLGVRKRGVKNA